MGLQGYCEAPSVARPSMAPTYAPEAQYEAPKYAPQARYGGFPVQDAVASESGFRIVVRNLTDEIQAADLEDYFSEFGEILECEVALDARGRSRGFGFVTIGDIDELDAEGVLEDDHEILGQQVRLDLAGAPP